MYDRLPLRAPSSLRYFINPFHTACVWPSPPEFMARHFFVLGKKGKVRLSSSFPGLSLQGHSWQLPSCLFLSLFFDSIATIMTILLASFAALGGVLGSLIAADSLATPVGISLGASAPALI